jgi:hypothetical protein
METNREYAPDKPTLSGTTQGAASTLRSYITHLDRIAPVGRPLRFWMPSTSPGVSAGSVSTRGALGWLSVVRDFETGGGLI